MATTTAPHRDGHPAPHARLALVAALAAAVILAVIGEPQSVVVRADSNLISHVTTEVVAGPSSSATRAASPPAAR